MTGCLRKRPNLFILYLVQALPAAWEGGRVVEMESNKQFSKNGSGLAQEEVDLATMGPGQRWWYCQALAPNPLATKTLNPETKNHEA